jgi:hypothetical protein
MKMIPDCQARCASQTGAGLVSQAAPRKKGRIVPPHATLGFAGSNADPNDLPAIGNFVRDWRLQIWPTRTKNQPVLAGVLLSADADLLLRAAA